MHQPEAPQPGPAQPRKPEEGGRSKLGVWAVTIATVFAFMGIGLVDPILPAIAMGLDATPAQTTLLFTSYLLVTAVMMLVTGALSSRIGGKATLLWGLGLIVIFAVLSGLSPGVGALIGFRAGWGLGNALFAATALAVIVAVSDVGRPRAIILYESALGVGLAAGPLVGAVLGNQNWRYPFFGTAVLMAVGFLSLVLLLPRVPKPEKKISVFDPLRALRHPGLFWVAVASFLYYCAFFTVLAYTPFVLGFKELGIGLVFFGWGTALAIFSVLVAPRIQAVIGTTATTAFALIGTGIVLVVAGFVADRAVIGALVAATVIIGAFFGINNTMFTEVAMGISPAQQSVASAGYNFIRWMGGAIAAVLAPLIGEALSASTPFYIAAVLQFGAAAIIFSLAKRIKASEEPKVIEDTPPD